MNETENRPIDPNGFDDQRVTESECMRVGRNWGIGGMTPVYVLSSMGLILSRDLEVSIFLIAFSGGAFLTGWWLGVVTGKLIAWFWPVAFANSLIKPQRTIAAIAVILDFSVMGWGIVLVN